MNTRLLFIVLLVLGGSLFSGALPAFDLEGVTAWGQRVALGSPESGVVDNVAVKPGDRVNKGDTLLELDLRAINSVIRKQQAVVREARDIHAEAVREQERADELFDRTVLSEHERQIAHLGASTAKANLARAEFELAAARLQLEYSRITAPFDGVVIDVRVQPGEVMISNLRSEPLVIMASDQPMRAVAGVPHDKLNKIRQGDIVQVALDGDWYEAKIDQIALEPRQANDKAAIYPVSAIVELPAGQHAGRPVVIRFND